MSINNKLIKLFAKDFHAKDFSEQSKARKFTCRYLKQCNVNIKTEACFTPLFGDLHTKIMLVAEAPSVKKKAGEKNVGPNIGGMLKNVTNANKALSSIRDFIESHYKTVPHFTDLMKCGAEKQTREFKKNIFRIRTENCFKHYLVNEIRILKPNKIFCLGWLSFKKMKSAQKNNEISSKIKIIKLLHYGSQASINLTSQDKLNYIWPLQAGLLKNVSIKKLNFYRRMNENN